LPDSHFHFSFLISNPSTSLHPTLQSRMPNPLKYLFAMTPTDVIHGEREYITYTLSPSVGRHQPRIDLPQYTLPDCRVIILKRCLVWRMAIDWELQQHVSELERPGDAEYSEFEGNCKTFGYLLAERYSSHRIPVVDERLSKYIFEPGDRIRVDRSKQVLELKRRICTNPEPTL
jgi:hypothetical protein